MYKATTYHEDSDADDEFERSVIGSPTLGQPVEYDTGSQTDSGPPTSENTPTTFTHSRDAVSPTGLITGWSGEQCADFVSSLDLEQYADTFIDQGITGDALVMLVHEDLQEMGIKSVGHRLTILKGVYDVKVKQNVAIGLDDYIPLCEWWHPSNIKRS